MSFNKKGAVLALAGVLALGGVGSAAAFIIKNATAVHQDFSGEEAIKIKWGTQTSQDLAVTGLTASTFVYKQVEVDVGKSEKADVTQGHIDFNLNETTEGQKKYIQVDIATTEFKQGTKPAKTLYNLDTQAGFTFELNGANPIYYLRFTLIDSAVPSAADENAATPAGKLTVTVGEGATSIA